MKVQQKPVSKRFGGKSPQNRGKKSKEEKLKAALAEAARKKTEEAEKEEEEARKKLESAAKERANRVINDLSKLFRNRGLIDFVPLVERRVREGQYPKIVLRVLLERIRRNQWNKLSAEDQILVTQAEASLVEQNN